MFRHWQILSAMFLSLFYYFVSSLVPIFCSFLPISVLICCILSFLAYFVPSLLFLLLPLFVIPLICVSPALFILFTPLLSLSYHFVFPLFI